MCTHACLSILTSVSIYQAIFRFTHVQPLFTGLTFRLEVDVELFNSKRVRLESLYVSITNAHILAKCVDLHVFSCLHMHLILHVCILCICVCVVLMYEYSHLLPRGPIVP